MSEVLQGLAPIVGERPRLLILGNMPSVTSLAAREYYGNPRNAFWRIAADVVGFDAAKPYPERVAALQEHGIAVWDVLRSCRRVGSLDSAVERDSMVPNDFRQFFDDHREIELVVFNGAAAEANYRRLVHIEPSPARVRLPSTSPAHTMVYADKLDAWRAVLG